MQQCSNFFSLQLFLNATVFFIISFVGILLFAQLFFPTPKYARVSHVRMHAQLIHGDHRTDAQVSHVHTHAQLIHGDHCTDAHALIIRYTCWR